MGSDLEFLYGTLLDKGYQERFFADLTGLTKKEVGHIALCPFHEDTLPTFLIHGDRPSFFCFVCSAQGDWIQYGIKRWGVSFQGVLNTLIQGAALEIHVREREWREELLQSEILEAAQIFFHAGLWSRSGKAALSYLSQKGYTNEEIKGMRLGFFPGYSETIDYLRTRFEECDLARIFTPLKDGLRDSFTIVIPYRDSAGRLMGIYGREAEDREGEDAYQPLTRMEHLRDIPFLMYKARGCTDMVVVDGFFDALLADQIGIKGVIGVGRSGLTTGYIDSVLRYGARRFFLSLSTAEATMAAMRLIKDRGFEVFVVQRPEKYNDTDAYIRDTCIKKFGKLVETAVPADRWLDKITNPSSPLRHQED